MVDDVGSGDGQKQEKGNCEQFLVNEDNCRNLAEYVNSIILRMDTEGRITFFNKFAVNFFGYEEKEILGQHVIGTIVPASDASGQNLKYMISDIMSNPDRYLNNENENILRDGQRVWIAWTNKPILDGKNNLKEVLCVGNDITKLKQATQERFETVIERLSEGVVSCNLNWGVKDANIVAKKYLGILDADNRILPDILFNNYSVSISKEEFLDLSKSHRKFDVIREETSQFKGLCLEVDLNVLQNIHGRPENIIVFFHDVTEARKEEMLKQDFLGLISHKLNTPTTVINQMALLFDDGSLGVLTPDQKECMDSIVNKSFQLKTLVSNLLAFTTIDRKDLKFTREPVEVSSYLPQFVSNMVKHVKDKKVEVSCNFSQENIVMNISREYLDLIISNLIENAIKFNDKQVIEIKINVAKDNEFLVLSIEDNGCGIPPEDYEKIFEKFYQIDRYFTGNVPGSGLGMALVKRLVSGYGGLIKLESQLGKGTKFIISFPD